MLKDTFVKDKGLPKVQDVQQRQLEELIRSLSFIEILQGRLLKDVTVGASGADFMIDHKLGRSLKGYFVTKTNHPLTLYTGTASAVPETLSYLRASYSGASINPVIDVWVY